MLEVLNPSEVVNAVFTVTGISTAGFNSTCTAQVRVTLGPKGGIGLGMLLDTITKVGAGTAKLYDRNGRQFKSMHFHAASSVSCVS